MNELEMDVLPIGAVVGIFDTEKDEPYQVVLKTDGKQWALAGLKAPWSTEALVSSVRRDGAELHLMRREWPDERLPSSPN